MARDKNKRGSKPQLNTGGGDFKSSNVATQDHNALTPKFCLAHIVNGYCLQHLNVDQQAAFALSLQRRCALTWKQITLAPRHGLGLETLPAAQIKPTIPEPFGDRRNFIVLRYSGKLPMVGVRIVDVFHVLWIERTYGDVYDHS